MEEKLQSISSGRNIVLRLAVSSGNVELALNQVVEEQAEEKADGVGDEIQSLRKGGVRRHVDYSFWNQ